MLMEKYMSVYYGRDFKAKCYNIRLINFCSTRLLVIERVEFPDFSGRNNFRYSIGQETVRISTHRKCMVY